MNTGYPAIITPQLEEWPCSEFEITKDEESWIGNNTLLNVHNRISMKLGKVAHKMFKIDFTLRLIPEPKYSAQM